MSDKCCESNCGSSDGFREAVCIHTDKIFDSCREEDGAFYKI